MTVVEKKEWLTTDEARKEIGVSGATFTKDVAKYGIQKYKAPKGNQRVYKREDIERLKKARQINPVE